MAAGVYEASHRRGVIPACAGSTVRRALRPPLSAGSSPHARGARAHAKAPSDGLGDQPRMRGEHQRAFRLRQQTSGIIPACAGSTRGLRAAHPRRGDHPRMRGEHAMRDIASRIRKGSSPHARGALGGTVHNFH